MLDTYIKNKGITKTILHNNNNTEVSEINWDAAYDGQEANISVDLNSNGKIAHYEIELDNQDLANILNIPSVDMSLEKRLKRDFKKQNRFTREPLLVELEPPSLIPSEPSYHKTTSPVYTHISSPLKNEEFIIPSSIDKKRSSNDFTKRPYRKHSKKSHKFYRRVKTSNSKHKTYRNKNKKTNRRTI
uniref:Uncharacterized protein n=1 Tax=viral metagenome TaxID=1070528 RepID=A0A6C0EPS3_9ZZZZ